MGKERDYIINSLTEKEYKFVGLLKFTLLNILSKHIEHQHYPKKAQVYIDIYNAKKDLKELVQSIFNTYQYNEAIFFFKKFDVLYPSFRGWEKSNDIDFKQYKPEPKEKPVEFDEDNIDLKKPIGRY